MMYATPLTSVPAETLPQLALFASILATATGYVANAVLGDRGFGTGGNGVLAFLGAMLGYYLARFIPPLQPVDQFLVGSLTSLAGAVALLIALATAKNRLLD